MHHSPPTVKLISCETYDNSYLQVPKFVHKWLENHPGLGRLGLKGSFDKTFGHTNQSKYCCPTGNNSRDLL